MAKRPNPVHYGLFFGVGASAFYLGGALVGRWPIEWLALPSIAIGFAFVAYFGIRIANYVDSLEDRVRHLEQMTGYDRREALRQQGIED